MGRFRDAERHSHQTSSGWFTRLKTNARAIRRDVVNRLRALFGVVAKLATSRRALAEREGFEPVSPLLAKSLNDADLIDG